MALVRNITTTLPIPHEAGNEFTIRKLPWVELRDARKKAESDGRQSARELGPELVMALQSGDGEGAKKVLNLLEYDVRQFDRGALLQAGVVGWAGPAYVDPFSPELLDLLDEPTAAWAAQAILDFCRPPSAEDRKNG